MSTRGRDPRGLLKPRIPRPRCAVCLAWGARVRWEARWTGVYRHARGESSNPPVPYWVVTLGGLPLLLTAPHLHLPPPSGEASGAGVRGCGYIDGGGGRVCVGCLTSGLVPLRMYRSHVPTIRADHTYLSHEPTTRADHTLRPHVLTTHADHTCRPHVPTTRTDHTSYFIADPTRRSHVPITRTRADHTYRPHAPHRPHVPITRADHT